MTFEEIKQYTKHTNQLTMDFIENRVEAYSLYKMKGLSQKDEIWYLLAN